MGWEYSDTDCKFGNVCSFYPRCTAKSEKECNIYAKDNRTFLQKLFPERDYQRHLLNEYNYRCKE
jgi:hypothetical protein